MTGQEAAAWFFDHFRRQYLWLIKADFDANDNSIIAHVLKGHKQEGCTCLPTFWWEISVIVREME